MKRETFDLETRFAIEGDEGVITGYAARFNEPNRHREKILPGAFRRTLLEHRAAGSRPLMLWSHNPDEIIGVWTDLVEDGQGLKVTGRLIRETTRGAEALALVKAGAVNGLSIGFRAREQERAANGMRTLIDIELGEISIVGLPSAGLARIHSLRSSDRASAAVPVISALKAAARSIAKR